MRGLGGALARPHQRPVYQSPYCCIMVRCSAVLMCPLKGYAIRQQFVYPAVCIYSLTQTVIHGFTWIFFTKGMSWFILKMILLWSLGRDLHWPSLALRGYTRPARSFRHEIDCSAETVRDTANVTIVTVSGCVCVCLRHKSSHSSLGITLASLDRLQKCFHCWIP